MNDLPSGWAQTTLGEIAATSLGKMLDRGKSSDDHLVPYLRNSNVQWGRIDLDDVLTMDIPPEEQEFFGLQAGDLLVCEGGEIGRCAIWPGGSKYMAFQKALHRVRPYESIPAKFILYLLEYLSNTGVLLRFATGSTIKHLPQEQLRRIPVKLPPLPEQQRIVAALEDHMSRLDAAAHNVNQAAAWVMQLRRSIYSYVASGRIMSNSDNGHSVSSELVNGWTWVRPDEVTSGSRKDITIGPFGSDLRVADYKEDGIPLVFVRNIRSGIFGKSSTRYISREKADELRAHQVIRGDVLITKMGEPPGDSCVYTSETPGIITADCIRLRPGRTWDSRYLSIAINSPLVRAQIARITRGIAQRKVSLGRFRAEVKIPVPPPALQSEVVDEAERLLSLVGSLEATLVLALKRRDSLRRALFTEAFAGRLVPQDTADEPAALLLERLQSMRALQPAMRRGRGTAKHALQEETLL
jgi:type I restriction enzyme, S subunit